MSRGLEVPEHSTQIGSSIASDSHYDQIFFFPGDTQNDFTGKTGIVDYDGAAFRTLWNNPDQHANSSSRTAATTSPITGRSGLSSTSNRARLARMVPPREASAVS